jgi:hypothetical protein
VLIVVRTGSWDDGLQHGIGLEKVAGVYYAVRRPLVTDYPDSDSEYLILSLVSSFRAYVQVHAIV